MSDNRLTFLAKQRHVWTATCLNNQQCILCKNRRCRTANVSVHHIAFLAKQTTWTSKPCILRLCLPISATGKPRISLQIKSDSDKDRATWTELTLVRFDGVSFGIVCGRTSIAFPGQSTRRCCLSLWLENGPGWNLQQSLLICPMHTNALVLLWFRQMVAANPLEVETTPLKQCLLDWNWHLLSKTHEQTGAARWNKRSECTSA